MNNGKHLTRNDRFQIRDLLRKGYKKKTIADILNCHINTITNELKRTCKDPRHFSDYDPVAADDMYVAGLKRKGKIPKVLKDKALYEYLNYMIAIERYSPKACLLKMRNEKISFSETIQTHNTIYYAVKNGFFADLSMENLPRRSVKNKKKLVRKQNRAVSGTSIEQRPLEILSRKEFGAWEMDCVIGQKSNRRTLLVLTERKTRFEILEPMKRKTTNEVRKALNRIEKRYGKHFYAMFRSITVDNGTEFCDPEGIEKSIYRIGKRLNAYYCHPYSSWERGSNENCNLLVRRWLPKSTDFDNPKLFNRTIVKRIEQWMNNYPRELFSGKSALMGFQEELMSLDISIRI